MPALTDTPAHAHGFAVIAMMRAGDLNLACGGKRRTDPADRVFTMAAGREPVEPFGPTTARHGIGRKDLG